MADNQLTIIDKINHIKHLILLGKSDHHLDEFEIELITKTAKKYGLTDNDITLIFKHTEDIPFSIPELFTDRLAALYDMVVLMISDLKIHENEVKFCINLAKKYEFNPQIIEELINDVLEFVMEGKSYQDVVEYLMKYAHPKQNLN